MIAPAVFTKPVACAVPTKGTVVAAVLQLGVGAIETAAGKLDLATGMRETALGPHGQRTAQRVQTESRVGTGDQVNAGNRRIGDQIPVDRVTEGLVDANTIDEDRQPLRRAEQRRSGEATVIDVGLIGVARHFIHGHGRHLAHQLFGDVLAFDFVEPAVVERLDVGRKVQARHADAGKRRGADNFDGGRGHDILSGKGRGKGGGDRNGEQ